MTKSGSRSWWTRAALAAVVGLAVAGIATPALAADDDDDAFDTKIIRQFLQGLGLQRDGAGIDYRERSPLVVPPNRNLPKPESVSVDKNPAWPTDPDVKRQRDAKAARKKPRKTIEEESVPLTPDQLRSASPNAARSDQRPTGNSRDPTAPSTSSDLGSKSVFSWDNLWGVSKEEYATFTGEPPRSSLIEPPPGYRTPATSQPYGVGKERWTPTPMNPMDSPQLRGVER